MICDSCDTNRDEISFWNGKAYVTTCSRCRTMQGRRQVRHVLPAGVIPVGFRLVPDGRVAAMLAYTFESNPRIGAHSAGMRQNGDG